jgi:peroxiredoxin
VVIDIMHIEDKTLESPVSGVNLAPGSFADQLSEAPTLLVFLRFFGCIFCRETVSDLRKLSEEREGFPNVLFVSEAGATEARAFVRRYWPNARVIADPKADLYAAFGVGKSILKAFSPGVFSARRRALDKGHEVGALDGNAFRMPGAFLVRGSEIVWSHHFKHSADQPDFDRAAQLAN